MEIRYNVTGKQRKELVNVIAQITEAKPEYMGMPSAAYKIDFCTVTKDGTLEFSDMSDTEIVEKVLEGIAAAGFECEPAELPQEEKAEEAEATLEEHEVEVEAEETETTAEEPEAEAEAEEATPTDEESEPTAEESDADNHTMNLTVSMPEDQVNMENLNKLLAAKGSLIKKALGIDDLPVKVEGNEVQFPWFLNVQDLDSAAAYTHFISHLCKMSKEQTRVTATAKDFENEKYAFRCFLLRLGFIGEGFKNTRGILLKNLNGSSAFKSGVRNNKQTNAKGEDKNEISERPND